ncbi:MULTISPECIES: DUF4402 domain-containing protein [Qipengyuania]|uniref:DUF4402 domain-containing protein n=1 Tax=Qipengyuania soli TaxID=2782568 RepID=A0A7S8F4F6_9SPHN|nr:DUF4402 domain-containing protein [Qipengyuania soli]QPC98905.1 DUF4402 domain-containing protein [Qipengyuania soli]
MKKIVLAAVVATAATIAVPAAAAPGDTATTTGSATATIVAPISISHDAASLNFGVLVSPSAASQVTVVGANATVTSGDAVQLGTGGSDSFTVTGDAGRSFAIVTGGNTMGGMSFTTTAPASGTIGAGGSTQFSVGGVLNIPASQAAGVYTTTYNATVTYN